MTDTPWTVRNKKIIPKDSGNWEKEYLECWIDELEEELDALEIRYLHDKNKIEDEITVLKIGLKEGEPK